MVVMDERIEEHFSTLDLDLRKTRFSRFIDQKVTPDVLSFIADCIMAHTGGNEEKKFRVKDIWNSEYFKKNVIQIYSKPSPENETATHEYDKFIGQPMRLLNYGKIIESEKKGNANFYWCSNPEILNYISMNETYSFNFLYLYLKKVLDDSGFLQHIERYKENDNPQNFRELKNRFQIFIRGNTKINTDVEINRIFPKVLNIFSVKWNIRGSKKGRISRHRFNFSDLTYNEINWRDIKKDKRTTRTEAQNRELEKVKKYEKYTVEKAKRIIRKKYRETEIKDRWAGGKATQVHHIFPEHEYPQFAAYLENLIKLTPDQHFTKAHPNNSTKDIDKTYQLDLVIAKIYSIEDSLSKKETYYHKDRLIELLNETLGIEMSQITSFDEIRKKIKEIQLSF